MARNHYQSGTVMRGTMQVQVIAQTSKADFCAVTGVSGPYVMGCSDRAIEELAKHPPGTYLWSESLDGAGRDVWSLMPEDRKRYLSTKDKAEKLRLEKAERERRMAEHIEKARSNAAKALARKEDTIASALYEFDMHNETWADAADATRQKYLTRARIIMERVEGLNG